MKTGINNMEGENGGENKWFSVFCRRFMWEKNKQCFCASAKASFPICRVSCDSGKKQSYGWRRKSWLEKYWVERIKLIRFEIGWLPTRFINGLGNLSEVCWQIERMRGNYSICFCNSKLNLIKKGQWSFVREIKGQRSSREKRKKINKKKPQKKTDSLPWKTD